MSLKTDSSGSLAGNSFKEPTFSSNKMLGTFCAVTNCRGAFRSQFGAVEELFDSVVELAFTGRTGEDGVVARGHYLLFSVSNQDLSCWINRLVKESVVVGAERRTFSRQPFDISPNRNHRRVDLRLAVRE